MLDESVIEYGIALIVASALKAPLPRKFATTETAVIATDRTMIVRGWVDMGWITLREA